MPEPDHIPAPAEHAPRKRSVQQAEDDLLVWEVGTPTAWILGETSVEVRR